MGNVVLDISISLDGFVAGPNDGSDNPMGDNGMRLHKWIWGDRTDGVPGDGSRDLNREIFEDLKLTTGSIVAGRRTYDIVDGWDGTHPFGGLPAFILSMDIPADVPAGETKFTFVTDGVENTILQAKVAAGDKNVYIIGGANVAQQCIKAGLVDELQLHIAPVLLGEGVRLFDHLGGEPIELEKQKVVDTPDTTHLRFRIARQVRALKP